MIVLVKIVVNHKHIYFIYKKDVIYSPCYYKAKLNNFTIAAEHTRYVKCCYQPNQAHRMSLQTKASARIVYCNILYCIVL